MWPVQCNHCTRGSAQHLEGDLKDFQFPNSTGKITNMKLSTNEDVTINLSTSKELNMLRKTLEFTSKDWYYYKLWGKACLQKG